MYRNAGAEFNPDLDLAAASELWASMPLVFEPGTAAMPPPVTLPAAQRAALFPNVEARTYPVTVEQAYEVVLRLVTGLGWELRFERPPEGA